MFILKQVFLSTIYLILGFKFCEYGMFTEYFKLPFWGTEWLFVLTGLIISSYVVFIIIPVKIRIPFLVSGFFGSLTGIGIWYFILGNLFFR